MVSRGGGVLDSDRGGGDELLALSARPAKLSSKLRPCVASFVSPGACQVSIEDRDEFVDLVAAEHASVYNPATKPPTTPTTIPVTSTPTPKAKPQLSQKGGLR